MNFKKIIYVYLLIIIALSNSITFANQIYVKITTQPMPGGNGRIRTLNAYFKNSIFKKEITSGTGFWVKNNYLIIFKETEQVNTRNGYSRRMSGKIYKLNNNLLDNIYNIKRSKKVYRTQSCNAKPLYENKKMCKKIGTDLFIYYLKMESKIKKILKSNLSKIQKAVKIKDLEETTNRPNELEWQKEKVVGKWASVLCKKRWLDKRTNTYVGIDELYILKKKKSQWAVIYITTVNTGRPDKFKTIKSKIPTITKVLANKLGLDYR